MYGSAHSEEKLCYEPRQSAEKKIKGPPTNGNNMGRFSESSNFGSIGHLGTPATEAHDVFLKNATRRENRRVNIIFVHRTHLNEES